MTNKRRIALTILVIGNDGIVNLRRFLKSLSRSFGMKCIEVREEKTESETTSRKE